VLRALDPECMVNVYAHADVKLDAHLPEPDPNATEPRDVAPAGRRGRAVLPGKAGPKGMRLR
jgi:hypothetical protein